MFAGQLKKCFGIRFMQKRSYWFFWTSRDSLLIDINGSCDGLKYPNGIHQKADGH
jgi:hypothetical protein